MADDWKRGMRGAGVAASQPQSSPASARDADASPDTSVSKVPPTGVVFMKKSGDFVGFGYQSFAFAECSGGKLLRVGFHTHEITLTGMNLGRLARQLVKQAVDRVEEQHDAGGVRSQEAEEKKESLVLGMEWKRIDGGDEGTER